MATIPHLLDLIELAFGVSPLIDLHHAIVLIVHPSSLIPVQLRHRSVIPTDNSKHMQQSV